jgi:hypothetical protein
LVAQFTGTFTSANFKPWTNQSSAVGSLYNGWDFNNGFLRNADNNGGATSLDIIPGALTASTTYIISLTRPGNFYINGAKKTQRLRAEPTQPAQNYVLGCRQNATGTYTNFASMVCGRVIAFNRVLTQAERWAVEAYLGTTFGVSMVQQ